MLLRFVGQMNLIPIYFVGSVFKGENHAWMIFSREGKGINVGLRLDMYSPVSLKLCITTDTTKLYSFISDLIDLTFIQVTDV